MASDKSKMFRKVSLDRLSSPEELDTLMEVIRPRSWMGLGALGILLLTVIVWGFVGSIPTRVDAQGVLIKVGGVFDVFAPSSGPVAEVLVVEGDVVEEGQLVARIDQPEIVTRIDNARQYLIELEGRHSELVSYTRQDLGLQSESLVLQKAALEDTIAFNEQRLESLEEQIANEESLLERGLITNKMVLQTKQAYQMTRDQLERSRNDLKQLDVRDLAVKNQKDQELLQSQISINDQKRNLRLLEEQLEEMSAVLSPSAGRILEVKARAGDIISRGTSMVSLQLSDQDVRGLQAVIYVPTKDGKYVENGMEVQISPLSAPREEFGFLMGEVTYVSEFPSTSQGMLKVLANDNLVRSLMAGGAPFAVYADLIPNPEALSGYKWSSSKGEQLRVNSGTLCAVTITVRERPPVELVIPYLLEKTGL